MKLVTSDSTVAVGSTPRVIDITGTGRLVTVFNLGRATASVQLLRHHPGPGAGGLRHLETSEPVAPGESITFNVDLGTRRFGTPSPHCCIAAVSAAGTVLHLAVSE